MRNWNFFVSRQIPFNAQNLNGTSDSLITIHHGCVFNVFFLFLRIQSLPLTLASLLFNFRKKSDFRFSSNTQPHHTNMYTHKHTVIVYYVPESMPRTGTVIVIILFLFAILLLTVKVICFGQCSTTLTLGWQNLFMIRF